MGPMSKSTVETVLGAVSFRVSLMDADSSFVVAQVISTFCVTSSSMQEWTPTGEWGKRELVETQRRKHAAQQKKFF